MIDILLYFVLNVVLFFIGLGIGLFFLFSQLQQQSGNVSREGVLLLQLHLVFSVAVVKLERK